MALAVIHLFIAAPMVVVVVGFVFASCFMMLF